MGAGFSAPVQTGPGAHPASCTMGTGSFLGVKRPGRCVDHPPPSSAEVEGKVELLPLWVFVACYRETFTFYFIRIVHFIHVRHQERNYYRMWDLVTNSLSLAAGFKHGILCCLKWDTCTEVCRRYVFDIYIYPAELHLSGLTGTASHPDTQKVRIIGFFSENRLHWQFEVKKNSTNGHFMLHFYLLTDTALIHNSLYVFEKWGKNLSHKKL